MSERPQPEGLDLEAMLSDALRPIEPPERLSGRVHSTLSRLNAAAATELADWAEELNESELQSLRDPRNWVRPVAATTVGTIAGFGLVALELRRRRRQEGIRGIADELRQRLL